MEFLKAPFLPFKLNFRGGREQIDISVYFPTFGIFFCEGRRRWASAVRAHPHLVEETSSLLSQLHCGKVKVAKRKYDYDVMMKFETISVSLRFNEDKGADFTAPVFKVDFFRNSELILYE